MNMHLSFHIHIEDIYMNGNLCNIANNIMHNKEQQKEPKYIL